MREKAKAFHDLAEALSNNWRFRLFEVAIANDKYKGASIYHYKEGILITEDLSKPDLALIWCKSFSMLFYTFSQIITNVSASEIAINWVFCVFVSPSDACLLTLDPDIANNHLTLSEGSKKATHHKIKQSYPDLPQ